MDDGVPRKRARVRKLTIALAFAVALFGGAAGAAQAAPCGLPDAQPLWIDYGVSPGSPLNAVMRRPGVIVGASGLGFPGELRAAGVKTVYFDLHLRQRVGTPSAPADPSVIEARANRFFDFAVQSTGCATPYIAFNELFGAWLPTPWSASNAQYRANVLTFLRTIAQRGGRSFLLLASKPYTAGEAGEWWRQVAAVADLVREVYFPAPHIYKQGPIIANRTLRKAFRSAIDDFTELGIPTSKIGLMLGFQTTRGGGGREALKPARAWFEVVKWQALAAKRVAAETKIPTVWSWGWQWWNNAERDPDKPAAACVYLWARDPSLCNARARAGPRFNASLTEGQLALPRGVRCTLGRARITEAALSRLANVTTDREVALTALLARVAVQSVARPTRGEVLAAERAVIAGRFRGSRAAYLAALQRARATVGLARGVLADELRQLRLSARLRVKRPSSRDVSDYYRTYANLPARPVEASPAPLWLGGRRTGIALSSVAPARIFSVPSGRTVTVRSSGEEYTVRALDEAVPLGALPLAVARPAIRVALTHLARAEAYERWLVKRQEHTLRRAVCARDELPAVGASQLTEFLPFLALGSGAGRPGA